MHNKAGEKHQVKLCTAGDYVTTRTLTICTACLPAAGMHSLSVLRDVHFRHAQSELQLLVICCSSLLCLTSSLDTLTSCVHTPSKPASTTHSTSCGPLLLLLHAAAPSMTWQRAQGYCKSHQFNGTLCPASAAPACAASSAAAAAAHRCPCCLPLPHTPARREVRAPPAAPRPLARHFSRW